MCGQDIDVKLVGANVRKLRSHGTKTFIPERHRMDDPVGFRRRGQMLLSFARQFKSETQYTVHAAPCEYGLLHGHLVFGAFIETSANVRIFAFVVFANDREINLTRFPLLQGRLDSLEEAHRPKIYILPESTPDGD